jgi:hypothetical protein
METWKKPLHQQEPEIKIEGKILPFLNLSSKAVESLIANPEFITVYWRHSYTREVGNVIAACYVTKTGQRRVFIKCFIQKWGGYRPHTEGPTRWTLEEIAKKISDGHKRNFCAPAYLILPGPDRRCKYLESLNKVAGEKSL